MKNFTGKVTNVDNNGNPIKKKSTGKNGKKSGFKKPAAVKKSSGKKPLKDITAVMTKKPVIARDGVSMQEAYRIMLENKVGKLPMVDANGRLCRGHYQFTPKMVRKRSTPRSRSMRSGCVSLARRRASRSGVTLPPIIAVIRSKSAGSMRPRQR